MKTFTLFLCVFFMLFSNANAENISRKEIEVKINKISQSCGPASTHNYVPDLELREQYIKANQCLKENIKKLAKDIFDETNYTDFCTQLNQAQTSYLQMSYLLNEKTKNINNLPGTFDRLQTQILLHDFLYQLLDKVIYYNMLEH